MKLFERSAKSGWGNRLNLIDGNNVFVGYDYDQSCCEDFGYYFQTPQGTKLPDDIDLDGAFFTLNHKDIDDEGDHWDEGSGYGFEILLANGDRVWFSIYNSHNGYYSHGFDFGNDDGILISDSL